jgi:phospholipid-binding lipoprotein MlaA
MTPSHLLPRAALLAAALLISGCAHQAATQDIPPQATVVDATPAVAETGDTDSATGETAARAAGDDATPPVEVIADAEPASLQPTEAERDFASIYGVQEPQVYDPIADPNLPEPAVQPLSYDPWEKYNRRVHRFNDAIDRRVAKPLATAYVKVVPRPVRLGVGNFFNNLGQPVSAVNALLQGKPKQAGQSVGRFLINSTLGIAGLFDPATSAKLPNRSEDFGQTLGVWGWKKSRYFELPLFGPRTIRDALGMAGDAPMSLTRPIDDDKLRVLLQGLQLVDVRTQLLSVDRMREGATDDYALVRDAWLQRRNYQIFGDAKTGDGDEAALPEYLQDSEDNPTVPIDAIPVIPGSP